MATSAVVLVGSATIDEQAVGASASRLQLGGVVTYGGAAFVRAGVPALAVCALGGPFAGPARTVLDRLGLGLCAGETGVMTSFRNSVSADGSRTQQILALGRPIDEQLMSRALGGLSGAHVHLGPLHGGDISPGALRTAVGLAGRITLDIQGLLRPARTGAVRHEVTDLLPDALAASSIVKAEEAELQAVLAALDKTAEELLREFRLDELLVTRGSAGGYVLIRAQKVEFGAAPAVRVRDPTGAGDVFFATYLAARLREGCGIAAACERAAAVAAQHVAGEFLEPGALLLPDRFRVASRPRPGGSSADR
jgi:sugar/nucleoside kinase (ribokinase family)